MSRMTDWDRELRKRRTALDRAETRIAEGMVEAYAAGHPYRWIAARVRMNHETVRSIVARLKAAKPASADLPDTKEN